MAAVRLKFPDGGGQGGAVAPWRDPTVWQRTGLLVWGGCRVAAVRRTGGSGVGTVSTVGLVARSHHGATLHFGSARGCWQVVGAWFFRVFSWGFVTKW